MRLTVRSLLVTLGATTALAALVMLALPAARAVADEGDTGGIGLRAALDAVDCTATPPTITVLGLTIDVSTATFDTEDGDGDHGDGDHGDGGGGDGGGDLHVRSDHQQGDGGGDGNTSGSCAALVTGQLVHVSFASDAAPLVATHVKQDGEDDAEVEIKAPLQTVDSTMNTITLLGLTVDAGAAELHGNDGEGDHVATDLGQLMPGQLADVRLDATKLPALVASEIDVQIDSLVVLQAPLDAVDCSATPPTITVLGLTIDVSTATFGGHCDGGGDGNWHDDAEGGQNGGAGCAALVPGELVHVVLPSDVTPLVATQVKHGGEDDGIEIKAPLQAFDGTAQTVTLLGLAIDASGAGLDGGSPPIDFTKLTAGQVAEVHLDGTKLPALVATNLQVTDVGSDIDVEVDDPSGAEIHDPSPDVSVDVTVAVHGRSGTRGKRSTTTVQLHSNGHGSFHLSGLPAGSAKISVTRVRDGVTMARSHGARLKINKAQRLRLRLRRVR